MTFEVKEMSNYTQLRKDYLPEWRIWYEFVYRCENNTQNCYVEVEVCDDWKGEQGFVNFMDDMGPRPGSNYYISRKNKLGDWEPSNVAWVKGKEQAQEGAYRSYFDDDFYKYRKLAKENGIRYLTFYGRVKRGWNLADAATLPPSQIKYKSRIT